MREKEKRGKKTISIGYHGFLMKKSQNVLFFFFFFVRILRKEKRILTMKGETHVLESSEESLNEKVSRKYLLFCGKFNGGFEG